MGRDIYKYMTLHEKIRKHSLENGILYYKIQALSSWKTSTQTFGLEGTETLRLFAMLQAEITLWKYGYRAHCSWLTEQQRPYSLLYTLYILALYSSDNLVLYGFVFRPLTTLNFSFNFHNFLSST